MIYSSRFQISHFLGRGQLGPKKLRGTVAVQALQQFLDSTDLRSEGLEAPPMAIFCWENRWEIDNNGTYRCFFGCHHFRTGTGLKLEMTCGWCKYSYDLKLVVWRWQRIQLRTQLSAPAEVSLGCCSSWSTCRKMKNLVQVNSQERWIRFISGFLSHGGTNDPWKDFPWNKASS